MELIADPGFDDGLSWDITTNEGSAVVTGGKLVCTGWRGIVVPVGMGTGEGIIAYSVKVDVYSGGGLAAIQNGSDVLWTGGYGVGTFTGVTSGEDLSISVAFTASNLEVDTLSMDLSDTITLSRDGERVSQSKNSGVRVKTGSGGVSCWISKNPDAPIVKRIK